MKRRTHIKRLDAAGLVAGLFAFSSSPLTVQALPAPPFIMPSGTTPPFPAPPVATPPATEPTPVLPLPVPPLPVLPTSASPTATPARTLTLDQVLTIALNNNSSVRLSREKVLKAQQLIYEANASGLPQISVNVVDTYSSNKTFGTAAGGSNATGTLPGGGQIPVIIDTGGGNATGVTSSGGGGTATGAGSTSTSGISTTSGSTGATGSATTTPASSTSGSGGTTGTGTTGTSSTGTFGTTGPTAGIGGATANLRSADVGSADLPPVMQRFAEEAKGRAAVPANARAVPHDTTTGTGTGTGEQVGNGSFNTGSSGYNNNESARVSVTQGVDIFRLVPAAEDVERITRDFYVTDLDRVQNETALSVKNQFFTVLRDQDQVTVYEQQVAADTESVRVTQARVTAGAAAEFDLLTAQTTLSNAQQLLSSARNTLTLAQVNLNNLLGLGPDVPIALQNPATPPLNRAFDTPQLTQTALVRRPELRQADNNIVIAQRLVRLAGVGLLPSLSIVGSGNYNGNVASGSHDTFSLSAVLGIPLYDGGTTRAKVKEAQSDLRSQQVTRDQLRENVSVEVRQALSNINDAQTRAASSGLGVTQAQEAYRLATVRYQNGIGTILDEINAQAQLAQARLNLLNAQYDYQTSLAQLTRALGGR